LISRRRFLERTGILAAGMSISQLSSPQSQLTTLDPDKLSPYVDPLPIPQIAQPNGMRPSPDDASIKLPSYRMAMRPIESKVHRDLPATRMWGFGSSSPGPPLKPEATRD
jgi:spore coat protein A